MATWLPKTEIVLFLKLCDRERRNSNSKSQIFDHGELDKVSPGDCDNDGQAEMARLTPKTAILLLLVVDHCRSRLGHFLRAHRKSHTCRWNFDIYHTFGDISASGLGVHIAISGCRWSSNSLPFTSLWSIPQVRSNWKATNLTFFYVFPKRNKCA